MRSLFYHLTFAFLVTLSMVTALVAYNLNGFEYDTAASESHSKTHPSHDTSNPAESKSDTVFPESQVAPPYSGMRGAATSPEELVVPRAAFMEAHATAVEVLAEAEKVADVGSSRETLTEAEENVWADKNNSGTILFETDRVRRETGRLRLLTVPPVDYLDPQMIVTEADALTDTLGLQTLPSYHPARIALDAIGGTDIKLASATSVCGPNNEAMACAYNNGVILIDDEFLNEDYYFLYDAMMHEYAHQIEYVYQFEMEASLGYTELFDGNFEWIADCMSAARIPGYLSGYLHTCSSEQLTYGERAWSGEFS